MTELRLATADDILPLTTLIEQSVRGLQSDDYSQRQLDRSLATVYGVDSALIADGTYFVVKVDGVLAACGGWSKRKTLFGGDGWAHREDGSLDPAIDAAKIRAFFVHPDYARRGLGTLMLEACERAGRAAGFRRFEMGATLTGVRLYRVRGYEAIERVEISVGDGVTVDVIRMVKAFRE